MVSTDESRDKEEINAPVSISSEGQLTVTPNYLLTFDKVRI